MNANTILWCLFVYCANMPKHAVHSAVKDGNLTNFDKNH